GTIGVVEAGGQDAAEDQEGVALLLLETGMGRHREGALGELLGDTDLAELVLEQREVAAALALELAILDVLDDLERIFEAAAGLLELAVLERQLAEVGEHHRRGRQRA